MIIHAILLNVTLSVTAFSLVCCDLTSGSKYSDVPVHKKSRHIRHSHKKHKNDINCDYSLNPAEKIDCGYHGITFEECENSGCCYYGTIPDGPNCFIPNNATSTLVNSCDFRSEANRVECGYSGISKSECKTMNCCFHSQSENAIKCFYPNGNDSPQNKATSAKSVSSKIIACLEKSKEQHDNHLFTLSKCLCGPAENSECSVLNELCQHLNQQILTDDVSRGDRFAGFVQERWIFKLLVFVMSVIYLK